MTLTEQDLQEVKRLRDEGYNLEEIQAHFGARKLKRGSQIDRDRMVKLEKENPQNDSFATRVGGVIERRGEKVQELIAGEGEFGNRTPVRRGVEATATAFGAVPEVAFQAAPKPVRDVAEGVAGFVGKGFGKLIDMISDVPALQKWVAEHPKAAKVVEEVAGTAKAGGEIAGTILLADTAAKTAQAGVDMTGRAAERILEKTAHATDPLVARVKSIERPFDTVSDVIKPTKDARGAIGEVLGKGKGTQREINQAAKAFKNVDTKGVKTFRQLQQKLDDAIPEYAKVVDDALAKDPTKTQLDDLMSYVDTKGGSTASTNYVKTSLDHLDELYTKTGDVGMKLEIENLITRAQSEGLTKLDVNNISRLYNAEFGSKAFSKVTGDPLTSVNAQFYENVRKGLKTKAREGIGGAEAKVADDVMSSIYSTKRLVDKNVTAVEKMSRVVAERGLLEKIGHSLTTYADVITGGSLRGFVSGLLPRGRGYKTLQILDLEERLRKNLDIINNAVQSGSRKSLIEAAGSLEKSVSP